MHHTLIMIFFFSKRYNINLSQSYICVTQKKMRCFKS